MGASLSVKLTQTGKNEASRTGTVSVVVTITSTAGTHNHYGSSTLGTGAMLYVTADGNQTGPHYVTFGSEETGTVSSTVYSNSFDVSYSSAGTKTVSVSARCITGTSAGTISGSNSLTLTPISASGGSSGGGDDDDDNTEEWNPDNPGSGGSGGDVYYSKAATVHNTGGFSLSSGDAYSIRFTAPKFSGTSMHILVTLEGVSGNTDPLVGVALCTSDVNLSKYKNTSELVTDAYRLENTYLYVIPGIENVLHIDTSEIKSETDYYLIFWQEDYTFSADKVNVEVFYDNTPFNGNTTLTWVNEKKIGGDGFNFSSSVIKFKSPTFDGTSTSIDVAIKAGYDESSHGSQVVGVALCTSSVSYEAYANAGLEVFDRYQIATAMMTIVNDGYGVVNIPTQSVRSNTDYYLILWIPNNYLQGGFYYLDYRNEKHRIRVNYTSAGGGDSGEDPENPGSGGDDEIQLVRGVFYIDNGTEYAEYECFIDNGTGWDLVGGSPSGGRYIEFSGTVTTNADKTAVSVNCGFAPDLVVLHINEMHDGYHDSCAAAFSVHNGDINTSFWSDELHELVDVVVHREDLGFSVISFPELTLDYVAIKYT